MYNTADDIKNEISFYYPIDNRFGNKKIGLICAYFVYSFYNVEKDEKIHLKNGSPLLVKRGCYTMKDIEKVSSGKVKYDSLTGKSVINASISRFGPYMNKILGISNENYIDMLLSKKMFSFKINKLSTTDNILNGKPCDVLYTGYLNKDISYGDIIYFEPKNVQYKKLVNGVIDQLKVSCRNIIRKLVVKLEGNEIISIDDYDILYSFYYCWKCTNERLNAVFQGVVEADGQTENTIKHRINAGDKANNEKDQTVASIYDNHFCIPLDFEILETSLPLYQYGLGSRLTYELTFADYSDVIKSTDTDATYTISNISLEFDTVMNASLAGQIRTEYMKSSILYDRILRAHIIPLNKSDTSFSVDINSPSKSLKGVLLIFTQERSATKFVRDTEEFYNPKITKLK